jgi:DNA invertase Pin-like site-specific DNA recombinase
MSSEPNDQLLLQIRGAVAEYERTLLSERMRRGRLAKYKAGLFCCRGRTCPMACGSTPTGRATRRG